MPLHKIKAADVMKLDDGSDSIDTLIRQAIGREPYFSFAKTNDSPVQWIQLLNALDHQDSPGWPLLPHLKVQMQKCDKCSREFCSTINYRRHMRLHRRNLNLNKDLTIKNRALLQGFWDKLLVEETMEIMLLKDVSLEAVAGSSIIKDLTLFLRKPGFTSLPQSYLRAGSAILDIVQARPSKFPLSSQDLFSILDDASERTFLCAGTAESLQKYVFDGDVGKGLEPRNLVACASFLIELKLEKAFLADKDAEALRYQKLLVEEEEAAQKRQAALLEKKRQKKLRQREQRAKEQGSAETIDYSPEDLSPSPTISSSAETPDSIPEMSETPCSPTSSSEHAQIVNLEEDRDKDHETETGYPDLGTYRNFGHRTLHRGTRRHVGNSRWQGPRSQRNTSGFHPFHSYQAPKPGLQQKHASYRDFRSSTAANGGKVWTPKARSETDDESSNTRLQVQGEALPHQDKKCEVLIGSISVALGSRSSQQQDKDIGERGFCEKPDKNEVASSPASRSTVKLWRPVSRHENAGRLSVQNCSDSSDVGVVPSNDGGEGQLACSSESTSSGCVENADSSTEGGHQGELRFSIQDAKAFLVKRYNEVMASDHVKLVLLPDAEPPPDDRHEAVPSSKLPNSTGYGTLESSAATKPKGRAKPEKGTKVKYIPKQRSLT